MTPKLCSATYVRDYTIRLVYSDGVEAEVDLSAELWGEVFEPLEDRTLFASLRLDEELGTVVWPNGADLAPEFLYAKATEQAEAADRAARGG